VYVAFDQWDRADETVRYISRIRAVAATRLTDIVFSHQSAAVLLGLPVLGGNPVAVHATTSPASRRRSRSGVVWHHTRLVDDEVEMVGDLLVTSVTRTLLDLARNASFAEAVVALDAGIRASDALPGSRWDSRCQRVDRDELREGLARIGRAPGCRRADVALAFADGRAESVGESLSRVQMHAWGAPTPELQRSVTGASGRRYRVDFAWRDGEIVGEFDGRVKYSRNRPPGAVQVEDVVWAEKRREDDLRATGSRVVRWTWRDALDGSSLIAALSRQGLHASTPRRPLPVFTKGTS
jgi:hypothetical protein